MGQRNRQFGLLVWALLLLATPGLAQAQFAAPRMDGTGVPSYRMDGTGVPSHKSAPRQNSFWPRVASPHPSVARIVVPEKNSYVSYGSGTLVDARGEHGLVITNWHVVRDAAGEISVIFPDGFRCAARVLKTDQDWDLAALAIWRPKANPVPLAANAPRPGDTLTIAGYGSGDYRAATGRCTGYAAPNANLPHEMVDVSATARQGDSGGPILNTKGELAGVLFGTSQGSTVGSYSGRVQMFLASLAPDLGRPDVSNIAAQPPPYKPPVVAAAPAIKNPARVNKPPVQPTDRIASAQPPADEYAMAHSGEPPRTSDRLVPVSPVPAAESRASSSGITPIAATDHVAGGSLAAPPGLKPLAEPPPSDVKSSSLEARVDLSRAAPGITWKAVAGNTLPEQIKTVLAGIGVLALLFVGLWFIGKSTPQKTASAIEGD